jgi:hypothetical protein
MDEAVILPPRAATSIAIPRDPEPPLHLAMTAPVTGFISDKQRLQFGLMSHDTFGAFTPQWTIGSSRRPPKPPPDYPGPGKYDPPDHVPADTRYPPAIFPRPVYSDATITSNVDMTTPREFPADNGKTISRLDGSHYYLPMPVSPAPSFSPPVFDPRRRTTIGPKMKDQPPHFSPGPAKYSPVVVMIPRAPAYGIPKTPKREVFEDPPDTPGPGTYETIKQLKKPKRWAGKLRVQTERIKRKEEGRERPWSAAGRD